jgi:hypothetical protein
VLGYDPEEPWEVLVAATVASILLAALTDGPPRRDNLAGRPDRRAAGRKAAVEALKNLALSQIKGLTEHWNPDGGHTFPVTAALPTAMRTRRLWTTWVC